MEVGSDLSSDGSAIRLRPKPVFELRSISFVTHCKGVSYDDGFSRVA